MMMLGNGRRWTLIALLAFCTEFSQAQLVSKSQINAITLLDSVETMQKLNIGSENLLTALVFLSPECPLCRNYTVTLNKLSEKYTGRVEIIGIVPGKSYTSSDIKVFMEEYDLKFPVYIDNEKELTNSLNATITPETYLLSQEAAVLYSGKIDDWVVSLGQTKKVVTKYYLKEAIEQSLLGKPVLIEHTQAVGCMINMY